jgi:hypothetical protein
LHGRGQTGIVTRDCEEVTVLYLQGHTLTKEQVYRLGQALQQSGLKHEYRMIRIDLDQFEIDLTITGNNLTDLLLRMLVNPE